jgi:hypothetical protein
VYTGEDLLIKISASNPLTGRTNHTGTVTVACYNPTKNPRVSETDRNNPDGTFTIPYDPALLAFYGSISTLGWATGTWTLLVNLTGDLTGHTYNTVTLVAG